MWLLGCITCIVFFQGIFICHCDGLRCYGCDDSSSHGGCEGNNSLLIFHKLKGIGYSRPCELPSQRYCMIESIKKRYETVSFIRDCSDGLTFSMQGLPRLERVPSNNQSTCAFFQGYTVCISLCRKDFCNGPQEDDPGLTFFNAISLVYPDCFLVILLSFVSSQRWLTNL